MNWPIFTVGICLGALAAACWHLYQRTVQLEADMLRGRVAHADLGRDVGLHVARIDHKLRILERARKAPTPTTVAPPEPAQPVRRRRRPPA